MGLTVGVLAKKFGLSRSTLLYYDAIGLLSPASHVKGEYRIYDGDAEKRLELICKYRQAGIPLKKIEKILNSPETSLATILQQRFTDLNNEILQLYEQQRVIANLLQQSELLSDSEVMTKRLWVSLLEASGYSEEDMRRWHTQFEHSSPESHLKFLKFLQLSDEEIKTIRRWAKGNPHLS